MTSSLTARIGEGGLGACIGGGGDGVLGDDCLAVLELDWFLCRAMNKYNP